MYGVRYCLRNRGGLNIRCRLCNRKMIEYLDGKYKCDYCEYFSHFRRAKY
jgi:hypothetical protein